MCQGKRGSGCGQGAEGRAQSEREPGLRRLFLFSALTSPWLSHDVPVCQLPGTAVPMCLSAPEVAGAGAELSRGLRAPRGWWVLAGVFFLSRHVSCQHLKGPRESRDPLWVPLVYQQGLASSETGCRGAVWGGEGHRWPFAVARVSGRPLEGVAVWVPVPPHPPLCVGVGLGAHDCFGGVGDDTSGARGPAPVR